MKEKVYDYIIYPANLLGCVSAINLANKGDAVLLLNNYGFAGGDLTNSLACYQKISGDLAGTTRKIYNEIVSRKNSVFYKNENEIVLNPETIKIVLQDFLEKSKIDLLFHILPIRISKEENFKSILLAAREGNISKKSANIIDASESYSLLSLAGIQKKISECYFNLFVCKSSVSESSEYHNIVFHNSVNRYLKLIDSRFWISLNIPSSEDELFMENRAQEILNKFEMFVLNNGGRVQLVAPQTLRSFEIQNKNYDEELVSHPKLNSNKSFNYDEIFLETNFIENEFSL